MMRVGLIHNEYGVFSGEEAMFYQIADLLRSRGHNVSIFCKSSNTINDSWIGKCNAFFSGIYRGTSRREIRQMIQAFRPDIIQVQNLYPLISPSVLLEIREHGIPIVMRCANYRLVCPNGLFLREGKVCQKCVARAAWEKVSVMPCEIMPPVSADGIWIRLTLSTHKQSFRNKS
jgi:hypothetical protein